MNKEPMESTILPEIKRRKRKVSSGYAVTNISYRSLFELYVRVCKIKNLSETTIKRYEYATRYFLDFAGYDLMCYDVTQELIITTTYICRNVIRQQQLIAMYSRYLQQFCME